MSRNQNLVLSTDDGETSGLKDFRAQPHTSAVIPGGEGVGFPVAKAEVGPSIIFLLPESSLSQASYTWTVLP